MATFAQNLPTLYFFSQIETIVPMIHNSSNDPVLIKKISLKIWSLRDEIESRIKNELEKNPDAELNLEEIRGEFSKKESNNVVELKSGAELDNSEDEMAKAMRGEEETTEENSSNVVPLNANANTIELNLDAPIIDEEKISRGKTVLSEINMEKMFFFCNKAYTEGQSIVIQFVIPKMFHINADILYCRPFNLKSRIISQNNFNYRVLVRFTFLKEGERALLRQFIQSIEPDLSKYEKKATAANEDGGDGFSELEDLGL